MGRSTNAAGPRTTSSEASGDASTRPWWRRWWAALLVFPAAAVALAGLLLFFFFFASIPLADEIGAAATVVLDKDGNEVGSLQPGAPRKDVALDQLPEHVPTAVMAAEDRGFYDHGAISLTGTLRALFTNVRAGGIEQGGSTITQQYVKNAQVGAERTFLRKAKEASLAVKMEQRFSKDQILELYLNTIYWGRGAYGIEAAANTYFDIPAAELDVNQAATLAGIIQAPEALDPLEAPEEVDVRRTYVLDGMLEQGWIDEPTHREVVAAGLPQTTERTSVEYGPNAYYLDAVKRELTDLLGDEKEVFRGLRVSTQLDPRMQAAAQEVVAEHIVDQPFSGALVSVDPESGGVRALVGGPDFATQQLNTAIRTSNTPGRQPGSAFKPFALAALVEQGFSPESRFEAPACLDVEFEGRTDTVCNYDDRDRGQITAFEATWASVNTAYMNLTLEVGPGAVAEAAHQLGIPDDVELDAVPSITLGTSSVSPLNMASAYATFAAGGVHAKPHLVTRVEDQDGEVLVDNEPQRNAVYRANDAHIVTDVLQGVISNGTGERAAIGRPAAGKTGTTQNSQDAWFVGYVPQLVTSVWVGNLDNTPMDGISGGNVPATIWSQYMQRALEGIEPIGFPEPDYGGKEILNEEPEPAPSPTEQEPCPPDDAGGDGGDGDEGGDEDGGDEPLGTVGGAVGGDEDGGEPAPRYSRAPDGSCVQVDADEEPSPSESPSPSPSPSGSPSPSPSPSASPSESEPSPSEEPSPEPSPTESQTEAEVEAQSSSSPEPTSSPSEQESVPQEPAAAA